MHWLETWFELIPFDKDDIPNPMQCTFHIPLHRYFSVFVQHAVSYQNVSLDDILPSEDVLKQLLAHPLQTLVSFYEILCGLWVRNGLQIKGQAMTYIQCHFCNSMVDADLFLIQQVATHVDPDWFIQTVFERFVDFPNETTVVIVTQQVSRVGHTVPIVIRHQSIQRLPRVRADNANVGVGTDTHRHSALCSQQSWND